MTFRTKLLFLLASDGNSSFREEHGGEAAKTERLNEWQQGGFICHHQMSRENNHHYGAGLPLTTVLTGP